MNGHGDDLLHATIGWRLTSHARRAAAARQYSTREILLAIADPEVSYTSYDYGSNRMVHKRGDLAVVADHGSQVVITVLLNSYERWTDDDARGRAALV